MKVAVVDATKSTEDKHGSIPTQLEDCSRRAGRGGRQVVAASFNATPSERGA
jgi:hypothetical protein